MTFGRRTNRLLKEAHLRHPCGTGTRPALALPAAYLQYAWTHLRWVPRVWRAVLRLDLFEQPGRSAI